MTDQKTRVVLSEENSWWIWWRLRVSGRPGWGHGPRLLTDVLLEMAVPAAFRGKSCLAMRAGLVLLTILWIHVSLIYLYNAMKWVLWILSSE